MKMGFNISVIDWMLSQKLEVPIPTGVDKRLQDNIRHYYSEERLVPDRFAAGTVAVNTVHRYHISGHIGPDREGGPGARKYTFDKFIVTFFDNYVEVLNCGVSIGEPDGILSELSYIFLVMHNRKRGQDSFTIDVTPTETNRVYSIPLLKDFYIDIGAIKTQYQQGHSVGSGNAIVRLHYQWPTSTGSASVCFNIYQHTIVIMGAHSGIEKESVTECVLWLVAPYVKRVAFNNHGGIGNQYSSGPKYFS